MALVQVDQLSPPLTEKSMGPEASVVAASLDMSGVAVMKAQFLLPALNLATHVTPLSTDLKMFPI